MIIIKDKTNIGINIIRMSRIWSIKTYKRKMKRNRIEWKAMIVDWNISNSRYKIIDTKINKKYSKCKKYKSKDRIKLI